MAIDAAKDALIWQRALRNVVSNYFGAFITLGIGFFLTPFILRQLGASGFGLWMIVGSVVMYGSLLDLGIAGAVIKYVAEHRARGETQQARSLVATALCLYSALGVIVIVVSAAFAPLVPALFNLLPGERITAIWLALLVGLRIGMAIPCTTAPAVLRGLQRYDTINLINTAGTILSAAATVVVLLLGGGVLGLVGVSIAVTLAMQAWAIGSIHSIMPELHFGWRGARRRLVRTVISFSSPLFVTEVSGCLQTKTDEFVIAASLPISAVAPYAIARRLSELAQLLTDQLVKVLLPLASELHAEDDRGRLRSLYFTSSRLTLAIFIPVGCILAVLTRPILSLWVGTAYADYAHLVIILTLASLINTSMWPAASILQSMARHRPVAAMSLGSGLANLVLSIALVHRFGLTGVALGTLIPTAAECLGLVLPYAMRVIGARISEVFKQILSPVLLPAVPMVSVLYVLRNVIDPSSLPLVLVIAGLGVLVYVVSYLGMGASKIELQAYRSFAIGTIRFVEARFKNS